MSCSSIDVSVTFMYGKNSGDGAVTAMFGCDVGMSIPRGMNEYEGVEGEPDTDEADDAE